MKTIIEMAREAGLIGLHEPSEKWIKEFSHLVALVRADERERFMQAVEELRPVQSIPLLQNKPPEFWIDGFKRAIEARGNNG